MRVRDDVLAARHLLRNLHNPEALKRNELVAELFADASSRQYSAILERVSALVAGAIDSLQPARSALPDGVHCVRQYAISLVTTRAPNRDWMLCAVSVLERGNSITNAVQRSADSLTKCVTTCPQQELP
ncbi:MAG: hypothetical protein GIX02_10890 [Candidatus Eremiobacteraeota bacterium]|nr:hypothetical protein [Candidatus Eremiobacteraeota bacterium]MBC5825311.1 hypothetical protein [Candidatus Eremiobacteraeota bacterium]